MRLLYLLFVALIAGFSCAGSVKLSGFNQDLVLGGDIIPLFLESASLDQDFSQYIAGLYKKRSLWSDKRVSEVKNYTINGGRVLMMLSVPEDVKGGKYLVKLKRKRWYGKQTVDKTKKFLVKSVGYPKRIRKPLKFVSLIHSTKYPEPSVTFVFNEKLTKEMQREIKFVYYDANTGSKLFEQISPFSYGYMEGDGLYMPLNRSFDDEDLANIYVEIFFRKKMIYRSKRLLDDYKCFKCGDCRSCTLEKCHGCSGPEDCRRCRARRCVDCGLCPHDCTDNLLMNYAGDFCQHCGHADCLSNPSCREKCESCGDVNCRGGACLEKCENCGDANCRGGACLEKCENCGDVNCSGDKCLQQSQSLISDEDFRMTCAKCMAGQCRHSLCPKICDLCGFKHCPNGECANFHDYNAMPKTERWLSNPLQSFGPSRYSASMGWPKSHNLWNEGQINELDLGENSGSYFEKFIENPSYNEIVGNPSDMCSKCQSSQCTGLKCRAFCHQHCSCECHLKNNICQLCNSPQCSHGACGQICEKCAASGCDGFCGVKAAVCELCGSHECTDLACQKACSICGQPDCNECKNEIGY